MSLLASYRSSSGDSTALTVPAVGGSGGDKLSDEFRLIKWHFLAHVEANSSGSKNTRVILITSAREGEGKSYVAHHLTANFALDPHIDLTLIDANSENPALGSSSWMGGSSGGPGLLDYLESSDVDQSRIIKSTGLGNVRVILSGNSRDSAPELLANGRLDQLIQSLASGPNSFVIIDAGPVLSDGGAAVLARYSGQIAFVVASNTTGRGDINRGLAVLDRVAGPIDEKSLGLIFN